jgi:hypothetical protein
VTKFYSDNRITLLHNGDAYFSVLEAALDRAVDRIYLETYIFENDHTGRRIAEALRRAALRGVKTHLLIDGFGSNSLPKTMIDYLEEAGVMVLMYRPQISPWTLRRKRLRRLHRKIVVVDRRLAFVGGMNIIDDRGLPGQDFPRYDYAVSVLQAVGCGLVWSGPIACVLFGAGTTKDQILRRNPRDICGRLFWYGITSVIVVTLKMLICRQLNRRKAKSFWQMPIFYRV